MQVRQTLLQSIGGTLTFTPQETGTISPATVDIFDGSGNHVVTAASATIASSPNSLSYVVAADAAYISQLWENLRVVWTYTISGVTYRRTQTFDVTLDQIYPVLTTAADLALHYPVIEGRDFVGVAKQTDLISRTWEELLVRIWSMGKNPNRLKDPMLLKPAHAAFAAARIARNYSPGGPRTSDWAAWADAREEEGSEMLRLGMSNWPWYDDDETNLPDYDNQHVRLNTVRLGR